MFYCYLYIFFFFFFSSRRRHTRLQGDWSSDVCSSEAHELAPAEIILDLDATDDAVHGNQEGRFFHGYYGHYCYLPLYIFCGEHLLCARLRPSNIDASAGGLEEVERIVAQIRQAWPEVKITLRGG